MAHSTALTLGAMEDRRKEFTRLFLFFAAASLLAPAMAFADPGTVLCAIATYAQGSLGKGVATLAVVSLGISACFGRASWTQAILISVGIAIATGASGLLTSVNLVSCP